MAEPNLALTIAPLFAFLIGLVIYEVRTGLIRDIATFPAAIYFIATSAMFGPAPWWQYPIALFAVLYSLLGAASAYARLFHGEAFGSGAIKLVSLVSGALGVKLAVQVIVLFFLVTVGAVLVANLLFERRTIPSSPVVLASVLCVLGYNVWW